MVSQSVPKPVKRQKTKHYTFRPHSHDSNFFINFTFDFVVVVAYRKMGGQGLSQKDIFMHQQMWCLIIEICDYVYNIVLFT